MRKIGIASTADVGRSLGVTRQTASRYLHLAEDRRLIKKVYERKDTKLYAAPSMDFKKEKTVTEINRESNEAFRKYKVKD